MTSIQPTKKKNNGGRGRPTRRISRGRKVAFSLITVALSLGALELGLRLAGFEGTTLAELQATAGFSDRAYVNRRDRALGKWYVDHDFPDDPGRAWVMSNPLLQERGFHDERFPVDPGDERRLFAIGGSTTYGVPFEHQEHGFPQRLQMSLQRRYPSVPWRVVNSGVAGMDSRAFPALVEQIVGLGAHGLVIYAGHNELRGDLIEACSDPYREGLERQLNRLRMVRLVRNLWRRLAGGGGGLAASEAKINLEDCMTRQLKLRDQRQRTQATAAAINGAGQGRGATWPARDDPAYRAVVRGFRDNLRRVLALAREHHVKVYLALPAVNYHTPPVYPLPHAGLDEHSRWRQHEALMQLRPAWSKGPDRTTAATVEQTLALDASHARINHMAGTLDLLQGRKERARKRLQLAVDRDYMGNRITSQLEGVLRQLCREQPTVTCVDVKAAFARAAAGGLPGKELLVDYCHPTLDRGVQLIADTLAAAIKPRDLARR